MGDPGERGGAGEKGKPVRIRKKSQGHGIDVLLLQYGIDF